MATYTKEQIELVNRIRILTQVEKEVGLGYEASLELGELQEQAKRENLCWW